MIAWSDSYNKNTSFQISGKNCDVELCVTVSLHHDFLTRPGSSVTQLRKSKERAVSRSASTLIQHRLYPSSLFLVFCFSLLFFFIYLPRSSTFVITRENSSGPSLSISTGRLFAVSPASKRSSPAAGTKPTPASAAPLSMAYHSPTGPRDPPERNTVTTTYARSRAFSFDLDV